MFKDPTKRTNEAPASCSSDLSAAQVRRCSASFVYREFRHEWLSNWRKNCNRITFFVAYFDYKCTFPREMCPGTYMCHTRVHTCEPGLRSHLSNNVITGTLPTSLSALAYHFFLESMCLPPDAARSATVACIQRIRTRASCAAEV